MLRLPIQQRGYETADTPSAQRVFDHASLGQNRRLPRWFTRGCETLGGEHASVLPPLCPPFATKGSTWDGGGPLSFFKSRHGRDECTPYRLLVQIRCALTRTCPACHRRSPSRLPFSLHTRASYNSGTNPRSGEISSVHLSMSESGFKVQS